MLAHKHITKIVAAVMAAAVCLCLCAVAFSGQLTAWAGDKGIAQEYETALFDTSSILSVNIQMDEADWNDMLENAMAETYYQCNVEVNGTMFYQVGIRPKGNTSLSAIANDDTTDRYSFKLEFDHYVDGQTCFGLDKLILNNNYADATNMKEALIYDMYQYLGADASLNNYAKLSVNGEYWGVYLALEAVEDSFLLRNYGTENGALYKPDSMNIGGGKDFGDFNADDIDFGDLDLDNLLRYMAIHIFSVNEDSLSGSMAHNYYLYEQDGQLAMIPWDYNLAFGTFQSNDADSAVNDDIDAVLSDRPMQAWIFSDEAYTAEYHALFAEFLETVDIGAILDEAYTLIAPYVEKDPTKFCTAEEFETGAAALRTFCQLRSEAVAAQLAGDETAVDASELTLSDMGTMNNGGGRGFDRGNTDDTDGQTPPERPDDSSGFTPPDGMDGNFSPPDGGSSDTPAQDSADGTSGWIWLGISAAVLLAAIMVAVGFRKRR